MEKSQLINDLSISLDAIYELSECNAELKSVENEIEALRKKVKTIGRTEARLLLVGWFVGCILIVIRQCGRFYLTHV